MEPVKTPRMGIGAETEYGLIGSFQNPGQQTTGNLFLIMLLRSAGKLTLPHFLSQDSVIEQEYVECSDGLPGDAALEEPEIFGNGYLHALKLSQAGAWFSDGARFYLDRAHPELSTPLVVSPRKAVLFQKAGDRIVELARRHAEETLSGWYNNRPFIKIFRNNSDGQGQSYAGHENYSISYETLWSIFHYEDGERLNAVRLGPTVRKLVPGVLAAPVMAFLVSRQIIIGAGKLGWEMHPMDDPYQITQRADFFEDELGLETMGRRPIINARYLPYADPDVCCRLHVIVGDTNISELSLYLKYGISALFFMMLEKGFIEAHGNAVMAGLVEPVNALRDVSRDLTLRNELNLCSGETVTALKLQLEYCALAKRFISAYGLSAEWADVAEKWEAVLEGLSGDSSYRRQHPYAGHLDWVVKERILDEYCRRKDVDLTHPKCQLLALQYHALDPERSVYEAWRRNGKILCLLNDEEIHRAMTEPPEDTRAWLRGAIVRRFGNRILSMGWDHITFHEGQLSLDNPFTGTKADVEMLFDGNPSLPVFLRRFRARIVYGAGLSGYHWHPSLYTV